MHNQSNTVAIDSRGMRPQISLSFQNAKVSRQKVACEQD
jgi:hypothetical protein